jgi:hypothetical protein
MFPNLRLMIVAVLASILGIICALGLFAEFRVSHDSFLRESNASAPLQLGVNDGAPARLANAAAPFEFRFQAQPPPAVIEAAARPELPDRAAVVDAPSAAATGSIADPNGQQEKSPSAGPNAIPGTNGALAARTPATSAPVEEIVPQPGIAPTVAPEKRKRATLHRRPVIVHRVQRARSAQFGQDVTALQPTYQWATQFGMQSPQPAGRRAIIRRVRAARKPAAQDTTPQTTVSNTPPVNPPE